MKKLRFTPILVFIFLACSKISDNTVTGESVTGSNNGNSGPFTLVEEAKKYAEYVCVVNNCAGTLCDNTKGSCKKKACEAIPDACTSKALTELEIEYIATRHAQKMVADGYIESGNAGQSKALVIEILRRK